MQYFTAKTPYFLLKISVTQKFEGVCVVENCFFL